MEKQLPDKIMDRKSFIRMALYLAVPIMIQNLMATLVNTADTIMLGYVSQSAMSAASLANQFFFLMECLFFGMNTGTSVLCAQYWGKGDKKTIERVMGLGIRFTLIISVIFFMIGFFAPGFVMKCFAKDPQIIESGINYLRVMSVGFLFMSVSNIYLCVLRSTERVVFPTVTYIVSLCVNIVLNACFIFGYLGFPKLGVVGVALGTAVARFVEMLMCLIHSRFFSDIRFKVRSVFAKTGILFKDFLKVAIPSAGNDVIWGLATSVFASILGHMGNDIVAANSVAAMVVNVGAIASRGFANATTVVVSKALGADNKPAAKVYGARMLKLTIIVSLLGCAIIIALRPAMCDFYADKISSTAIEYLGLMMIMTTWRLVGEGINTCLICGCFRGGGDSGFGMKIDTIFMWLVAVPLMAAAAYLFELSPMWVYFVMTLDEYEKMPVVFVHYRKYKWLTNITRDEAEL